jgi:alpha-galactosidase
VSVTYRQGEEISIRGKGLVLRVSPQQALSVALLADGRESGLGSMGQGDSSVPSDYVTVSGKDVQNFEIQYSGIRVQDASTRLGHCRRIEIPSRTVKGGLSLRKVLRIDLCPEFPQSSIFTATYENLGAVPVEIERMVQVGQTIGSAGGGDAMWTFQGASLRWGIDQIFEVPASWGAENPIGQIVPPEGLGGGIPVNDFWSSQAGIAIGHVEPDAVPCWMPVRSLPEGALRISLETRPKQVLAPHATISTPRAFVTAHRGDFYEALAVYRAMLVAQGVRFLKASESLYGPVGWTYAFGHHFRPEEVYNAIPKYKELGIQWLIINNRWWDHYGDWMPRSDKFGSEAGFKRMLGKLRQDGLKSLLWWLPYGVQIGELPRSGLYNDPVEPPRQSPEIEKMVEATADVALRHRDWLVEDERGKLIPITRNLAALCPAYSPAREYMVELARRMIRDWNAGGFYMDVVYTVPACHNPIHRHSSPYDSVKELASLFQEFGKVLEQYNPQGMLMLCPCGTTMNHSLLPTTNEPVTADPIGAEHVRWRIKMYKALMGPTAPVFADRVESTRLQRLGVGMGFAEVGSDFASCMGPGGIISSNFIWPKVDKLPGDMEYRGELDAMKLLLLTPEKQPIWRKWFSLYREKMISSGEFLNLYALGFDAPEGYAIRKAGKMYYAFFVPASRSWGLERPPELPEAKDETWEGRIELRGLDKSRRYQVFDYEHGTSLGTVAGSGPYIDAAFTNHLMLEVSPAQ